MVDYSQWLPTIQLNWILNFKVILLMKTVVFILFGKIKYDGRVQKEINTLLKNGFHVELIVSKFEEDKYENYPFKIYSLGQKSSKYPIINFLNTFFLCFYSHSHLKKIKPDIVHCNDLNTLLAGYLFKRHNPNVRLIYDAHELYPESQKSDIRRIIWNLIEKRLLPLVDTIILPERNRAKYFRKKYKIKKEINVIPNYPKRQQVSRRINLIEKALPHTRNKIKVLYIGMLGVSRSIREIALAFKILPDNYCLVFAGIVAKNNKKDFELFINEYKLNNKIFYLGPVPNADVFKIIFSSDIGIVFYKNTNLNNYYCASNKLYEFIAAKKPVITNDYPGLLEVVKQNNLGICLEKVDISNIANAVQNVKSIFQPNGVSYYWDDLEGKFIELYDQNSK